MIPNSPRETAVERPLPLVGPLATQAFLGAKWQSRRPISGLNSLVDGHADRGLFAHLNLGGAWVDPGPSPTGNQGPYLHAPKLGSDTSHRVYSRVMPGDRFWIREPATVIERHAVEDSFRVRYDDGSESGRIVYPGRLKWWPKVGHKIPNGCIREAARTVVTVTAVRPERVQTISEAEARAEGVGKLPASPLYAGLASHREGFAAAWEALYPGSWERNDWIWVYTWEPHKA